MDSHILDFFCFYGCIHKDPSLVGIGAVRYIYRSSLSSSSFSSEERKPRRTGGYYVAEIRERL